MKESNESNERMKILMEYQMGISHAL